MTIVTMSEAGLVELPEDVRKQFNLFGPSRLELEEVKNGAITLRPETPPPKTPDVSIAWRGKRRVIVGAAPVTSQDIVRAITG